MDLSKEIIEELVFLSEPESPMVSKKKTFEFEYDSQEESESEFDEVDFRELSGLEAFQYLQDLQEDIKRMQHQYDEYHLIFKTKFK